LSAPDVARLACRFNGNLHFVGRFSMYTASSGKRQIFPDKLIRFRVDESRVDPAYVRYAMNAAQTRQKIESFCATTAGNIGISATNLKTVTLPVPPLAEQERIVAKVDQLLSRCDYELARCRPTTADCHHRLSGERRFAMTVEPPQEPAWQKWCRFADLARNPCEQCGDGFYQVRATLKNGNPIMIQRACGVDPDGILYIGRG
jgi:hypothetical protein